MTMVKARRPRPPEGSDPPSRPLSLVNAVVLAVAVLAIVIVFVGMVTSDFSYTLLIIPMAVAFFAWRGIRS